MLAPHQSPLPRRSLWILLCAPLFLPSEAPAQLSAWNAEEALALGALGHRARQHLAADGELERYRALVEGHVYFFLDPEGLPRSLIRIDQVAVELSWEAPGRVHQRLIGERSETRLPVQDFRYYLDRLTLVEYGFGDEIRIGSGLDVAGVPHPFAFDPGDAAYPYELRMGEALTLSLPGRATPLRLRELEVRPVASDRPGILGVILLDEDGGDIVRMRFSFTPASYVDPRTDRITVELDYGLWADRYWLPNRQKIEVRREVPEIDLGVGTVIRSVLTVSEYDLNVPLSEGLFSLSAVTALPESARRGYPFREGLYDRLQLDGLSELLVDTDPRALRAQAVELLRGTPPTGLAALRFHLPRLSSGLRYSRTEGLFLGGGVSWNPTAPLRLRGELGGAPGAGRWQGRAAAERILTERWDLRVSGSYREVRELGLTPAADPLLSSLATLLLAEDYRDPYWVDGVGLELVRHGGGGSRITLHVGRVAHRSAGLRVLEAPLGGREGMRPLRGVAEGQFWEFRMGLTESGELWGGGSGRGEVEFTRLTGGRGEGHGLSANGVGLWETSDRRGELRAEGALWGWWGDPLPQGHRLLGGRGSLPGYPFRDMGGRAVVQLGAGISHELGTPLLRGRLGGGIGWADGRLPAPRPGWEGELASELLPYISIGVGVGWDLLRVEASRGLRGGGWEWVLSIDPRWWGIL